MKAIAKSRAHDLYSSYRKLIASKLPGHTVRRADIVWDSRIKNYNLIVTLNGYDARKTVYYDASKNIYKLLKEEGNIRIVFSDEELYGLTNKPVKVAEERIVEYTEYMVSKK